MVKAEEFKLGLRVMSDFRMQGIKYVWWESRTDQNTKMGYESRNRLKFWLDSQYSIGGTIEDV